MATFTTIQVRRDSAANWESVKNTAVLAAGEWGLETDTLKFKIGNGTQTWAALPYFGAVTSAIDTAAAAAEAAAKTYADDLAVSGVHYKGEVADMTALNAIETPALGDEYLVLSNAEGHTAFAIYDGENWDTIDINIDLSGYYTKDEVDDALSAKENTANKGVAGGYASLGNDGKLVQGEFPTVIDGGNAAGA